MAGISVMSAWWVMDMWTTEIVRLDRWRRKGKGKAEKGKRMRDLPSYSGLSLAATALASRAFLPERRIGMGSLDAIVIIIRMERGLRAMRPQQKGGSQFCK